MRSFFNKKEKRFSPEEVADYYDQWTDRYTRVGGELIEAFRTKNDEDLLRYYIKSAQLQNGQKIVDAGCGVGGPAGYFAEKLNVDIDAVTISEVQVVKSKANIAKRTLSGKVRVQKGDYHRLDSLFSSDQYDRVLFLESLGHADSPEKVIRASHKILKAGGCIYIKDFFQKESDDAAFLKKCRKVVANINQYYAYNTLDLHQILTAIRKSGFEMVFLKKPEFQDDVSVRLAFESQHNINIFGDYEPFVPTDWYEIFAKKV